MLKNRAFGARKIFEFWSFFLGWCNTRTQKTGKYHSKELRRNVLTYINYYVCTYKHLLT